MRFFSLLALAASAVAEIGVGYDALPASSPGLLSAGGEPVTPNPFKQLNYAERFTVVKLNTQLLGLISPPSPSNVIVSRATIGRGAGSISKVNTDASVDFRLFYFACTNTVAGQEVPTSCQILVEASRDSGIGKNEFFEYSGSRAFARAEMNVKNARRLSFSVQRAGTTGELEGEVNLLIDSLYYTPKAK